MHLDTDLNVVGYQDYGVPYLTGRRIKTLRNNHFGVIGNTISFENNIAFYEPGKLYFLKAPITELNLVSNLSSIEESTIRIFPNPSDDYLEVDTDLSSFGIEIYDVLGRKIVESFSSDSSATLATNNLDSGLYIVHVKSENAVLFQQKIVVQH